MQCSCAGPVVAQAGSGVDDDDGTRKKQINHLAARGAGVPEFNFGNDDFDAIRYSVVVAGR
jgi:hypothetical protein